MHNTDPQELLKFETLASRWWDPNSEFAPLHAINPLRLNYIDSRASLAGARVLDVGCGGGILSESLAVKGAKVVGIDAGLAPINVARLHAVASNVDIDYRHTTVESLLGHEEGSFDVICCLEMLEHVPDPASAVEACSKLVRPGGSVFFSTINRNLKAFMFAIVGAEYVLSLLPRGTHDYKKFIRPSELDGWARPVSLSLSGITGMHYNPLTKHYFLGDGVAVNYICHYSRSPAA